VTAPTIRSAATEELDDATPAAIVRVCLAATGA
jgi:hypothetical protein